MNNASTAYPRNISLAFSPGEKVWLFLTTLYHRRFVEDAIHIVGLPSGSHMRLRYRKQYVDPVLWNEIDDGGFCGGEFAVIALAATEEVGGENVVHPLRRSEILSASCEGSVLVVDIVLRDFLFNLPSSRNSFWAEARLIARNVPAEFSGASAGGVFLQRLASSPQALSAGHGVAAWEKTAAAFFEVSLASTGKGGRALVPFLYYIAEPARSIRLRLNSRGTLSIEAGCTITLEIHTVAEDSSGGFRNALGEVLLELSHPVASFLSSRRVRVDSRRDVKAIKIVSPPVFRRAHGHLSVRMVKFDSKQDAQDGAEALQSGGGRTEVVVSRYDYPLRIGRWIPSFASVLVAAAAGLAAYKPSAQPIGGNDWVLPGLVFAFALAGLMLGLRKDGKG